MTPYVPPSYPAWLGDVSYIAALALFVWLQQIGVRLREHEADTWWAGNGRDVVNALAVTTLSAAIWTQGISFPLALLFGGTLTLLLTVLHMALLGRVARTAPVIVAAAVLVGAPLVFAPATVARAGAALLAGAFPSVL